ncbi:MAG: PQQ-binding-like beta-propeller repeat protein [Rhodobacteraceae bacterium]|nr:PQQ-binding-like beta-propeller repeat protein [Paracoccaceae bacterium]
MGKLKAGIACAALTVLLVACGEREEILPGVREDLRAPLEAGEVLIGESALSGAEVADVSVPFSAPAMAVNADWTHRGGDTDHFVQHPALATDLQRIWSVSIGQGNARGHRITADPVVADGRVFTLDSRAQVTAVSTAGQVLWTRDLTPLDEGEDDASGGGLAVSDGRLFVTSGFGRLTTLDAATGAELWTQRMGASVTTAPTVFGDTVYAVTRDSRVWSIDVANGRLRWIVPGVPSVSAVAGAASPALTRRLAYFPLPTGELVATFRQSGLRVWTAPVSGARQGRTYTRFTDVTGDPVIVGRTLYTGNPAGRTLALDVASGERLWTAPEGALGPVQVAGDSVFLISDQNELVRLNARTGGRIWGVELPLFQNQRERRRKAIYAHYGPLFAGGRLYVASGDEVLRVFDPETGAELGTLDLPGGAASLPAVAGQTLFVVTASGQLHAFR